MTNNNITPPCPDCRHPSACHLHGCYTAASQPPVTMDGLVERLRHMADNHHAIKDSAAMSKAADAITTLLATIERQREALEAISKRCPPFDGNLYALPSDFSNSQEYAFHVEAMVSAGSGDIARKALESQP